jgi:hypothetical protein
VNNQMHGFHLGNYNSKSVLQNQTHELQINKWQVLPYAINKSSIACRKNKNENKEQRKTFGSKRNE